MTWANELFEKKRLSIGHGWEEYRISFNDLTSAVLEKNKEIEEVAESEIKQMKKNKLRKDIYETHKALLILEDQARAFRELVSKAKRSGE